MVGLLFARMETDFASRKGSSVWDENYGYPGAENVPRLTDWSSRQKVGLQVLPNLAEYHIELGEEA